jgi:hypothetical protein
VLEAGSALGFLVHPPLKENEAFHIGYQGEGRYEFVYHVNVTGSKWETIFSVTFALPIGGFGMRNEEVKFLIPGTPVSREAALLMAQIFLAVDDLGTPAGAVTLRGAWNFQTPSGWDTVYTPVFNVVERPIAPMLVVRVETDWYAHDTGFRYVLQPGEGISGSHSLPIGQVLFLPRDEITLRDCTAEELAEIGRSREEFSREKASAQLKTSYGVPYSPHYLRASRSQNTSRRQGRPSGTTMSETVHEPAARHAAPMRNVGRNDPCPCGSGRKYKKCHGESS